MSGSISGPEPSGVTAVVVTYNSARHIGALLDSIPRVGPGRIDQVVVVDNGSSDNTVDLLRSRGDCTVVRSTNRGYGAGLNEGARHSSGAKYFLILNPDAILFEDAVVEMLKQLASGQVGIVAPQMFESDGELSLSQRREPSLLRVGGLSFTKSPRFSEIVHERSAYENSRVVDWAVGAVMLISRDCWYDLDGFDESFFLYSEETDFCLRARDRGWLTVYTPKAHVVHLGGGSGESDKTHVMKMVNRVRMFRRRNNRAKTLLYYAMAVVTEVRRGILGHRASWEAARALLRPARRPSELNCSDRLIPV